MNFTKYAIDNNRVTAVFVGLILLAGLGAYRSMPRDEDPGFVIRAAKVFTYFPGASPARVEQLITDKIEKAVQEIPELDYVNSVSKSGFSDITVNIKESYKVMRPIWDDLRRKVDRVRDDLPAGIIGPIVNDEFGDVFGHVVAITGEGYTFKELKDIADDVRDELLMIGDAAKVDIYGAQDERVFIEYNNARLAELGISPTMLSDILESRNIIIPGGSVSTGRERITLEPSGNFESLEEIGRSVINIPGTPEVVFLEDLVRITREYIDPPTSTMHYAGTPCLGLAISMRKGGNIVSLGDSIRQAIAVAEENYPIGIEFAVVASQSERVTILIQNFVGNLVQSVVLVIVVMLFSLGLRTGLTVASLIPSAIMMAILFMPTLGIGLDQISLAALIIALGMLVDNAIVMSESILVQMEAGKSARDAAIDSANELKISLLTSSLTTAAAFLPIYLAESSMGEYCAALFSVVTLTLMCSWLLALTVVPLLCMLFLRVKKKAADAGAGFDSRFYRTYRGLLLLLLRFRYAALVATVVLFVGGLALLKLVPVVFMPDTERTIFTVEFEWPTGTDIEFTDAAVAKVEKFMQDDLRVAPAELETPGVVDWSVYVGQGGPRYILSFSPEAAAPEYGFMLVNTNTPKTADVLGIIERLEDYCFENFPDLDANIQRVGMGKAIKYKVEVRISGRDTERIFSHVDTVADKLREIPGIKSISNDWGLPTKKLVVDINQPRAYRAGVSSQDIAVSLQAALDGYQTTEYRENDDVIPVVMRSSKARRDDLSNLETINVYKQASGESVPLKQVADVGLQWEPSKILRRDRLRTVTVRAQLDEGVTASQVNAVLEPWLREQAASWPLGDRWEFGGEAETSQQSSDSIAAKLPVAGFLIVLLLVMQFNSIRKPTIILLTIPLGLIGVALGLYLGNSVFSFFALLGLVSLAGIVINNAIVLIDRIQIEMTENGHPPARAIIESAQRRLRPILLTTCTTLGGMIPLYLGGGPTWQPMALAIMAGLVFATALTLGFVPVLYSVLYRVSFKGFRYESDSGTS